MARIRSIHPGMASDESYMSMSMAARAAWPLLWTECDDQGVFEWKPMVLKARIFPADNLDFVLIMEEWESLNCVKKFTANGKSYGMVRNFRKYQRPKKPNSVHPIPEQWRNYIGVSGEVVPHQAATASEIPPQMKDEGDKMKDEGGRKEESPPSPPELSEAVAIWNEAAEATGLPKIQRLTEPRSKALKARLSECGGIEGWRDVIKKVRDSPFLRGENDRGWKADFDFILHPKKFTKLMEGSYDGTRNSSKSSIIDLVYEALQPADYQS